MTDPTGKIFLSYKHEQSDTADLLEDALWEHGVPVWRDQSDQPSEPLESGLEHIIEDKRQIAGGIGLISEDVADSDVILDVELPRFRERWEADDTFLAVIVRCPDIGVSDAKVILSKSTSLHDFSSWYMEQLDEKTPEAGAEVADFVLQQRLTKLDAALDDGQSITCSLDTYEEPAHKPRSDLRIDWSQHFDPGPPSQEIWNQRLIPALTTVTDRIRSEAPGRPIQMRGYSHLPASFALGRCLQATRNVNATWMQADQAGNTQAWSLDKDAEASGISAEFTRKNASESDLAVLVSISDNVRPEVANTVSDLSEFRGVLEFTPGDGPDIRLTPDQAGHAASVFRTEIRKTVNEIAPVSKIHLFMAAPTGLAFLFGQQTNTFPPIQTYLLPNGANTYHRAALLLNNQSDDNQAESTENPSTLGYRIKETITNWFP
ncbi:SAVED domain-containing protein [Salinadaptatus halalkaliphilus]|uniref:SAVED domain-containing protein n=1 Tax=Salinadaptatus halalkaliphilus TaxID=2419781 RepID=A0A4S3TQ81_9EURY|nr:SAVED domain-containing protein [Salinadaptatus halalkaliphilus]THE66521.1 SAVED domain-containing protein [Salinadaptatus halalkaliphilus]